MTTKEDLKTEKKKKESIKSAKAAEKVGKKNKASREAKKAGDKALLDIAAKVPMAVGGAKAFLLVTHTIDKLEEDRRVVGLAIRGERAKLKEMKIELRPYDHVRKLRKMTPEDAKSFNATVALYSDSLGLELSEQQKALVGDINQKREEARKAMAELGGHDTGREVGSGGVTQTDPATMKELLAASTPPKPEDEDEDESAIPAKNEALSKPAIRLAAAPTSGAH